MRSIDEEHTTICEGMKRCVVVCLSICHRMYVHLRNHRGEDGGRQMYMVGGTGGGGSRARNPNSLRALVVVVVAVRGSPCASAAGPFTVGDTGATGGVHLVE